MRVLFVVSRAGPITGSSVYQEVVLQTVLPEVDGALYRGAEDLDTRWDWIHVLDGKHLPREISERKPPNLLLDLHDHYWTSFRPFPSPDLPLRLIVQKARRRRFQKVLSWVNGVVVHSRAVGSAISHERVYNVGLGVRLPSLRPVSGLPPDRILLAGRDLFRKGFTTLLSALRRLRTVLPQVELWVAGDEYPHSLLAARLLSIGLPVRFLGECSSGKMDELYRSVRVVVLPSWMEALGLSILEAMAHRVPVVAAATGGLQEVVEDGETGQLFPPGDAEKLAEALHRVWNDPGRVAAWAENGYRKIEASFTHDQMRDRIVKVYRNAPSGR